MPPVLPNIEYCGIADEPFVQDLATAECLVTTAGNQLIGEAYALGRPVLAIPEPGNFEQQLNAWLVTDSRGGWSTTFDECTPHLLEQFLIALPGLRRNIAGMDVCGNDAARAFIESHLSSVTESSSTREAAGVRLEAV
jgi:UDP-N-acetylglucosamine:LPS N-acetylglucosamine transferase